MSLPLTQLAQGRTLFHWSGIAIQVSLSFVPLALLLTLGLSPIAGSLMGCLIMVALFTFSILAHELGHALTARVFGIGCPSISLHLLGGLARLDSEAKRPSHEILIAAAGPAVSFVLAGCFYLIAALGQPLLLSASGLFYYLSFANLILALFNLLPGLPLDGGRILRGFVWAAKKDRRQATIVAAKAGEVLAYAIFFLAFLRLLGPTGLAGALWPALMGYFLWQAARQEGLRARLEGQQQPNNLHQLFNLLRQMQTAGRRESGASQRQHQSDPLPPNEDEEVLRFGDGRELYVKRSDRHHGRNAGA